MIPKLKYTEEKKERKNFYASDNESLGINIILDFKGVERTNPPEWYETAKWGAGKGVELQLIKVLKENGIVAKDFDQDAVPSTKIEREGVVISMKFDAIAEQAEVDAENSQLPNSEKIVINKGEPIELKSINNKNSFDIQKYIDNKPKSNYVKQLAIYMDALNQQRGHLLCVSIDGLHAFWFVVEKQADGTYKAGDMIVDIRETYKRFAEIWKDKDLPLENLRVYWNEEIYKIPIKNIDWTKLSTSKIGDVRNGRYVVGSENKWLIDYSPYKKLILEAQNATLGYTEAELETIKEATAGFSSKKKNETKVS